MSIKKTGLGKNLNALLSARKGLETVDEKTQQAVRMLSLDMIQPGQFQPRKAFEPLALASLSESIREQGIIQPLLVRKILPDKYEIIAGERRFRAAQMANLTSVPVIIKVIDDKTTLALALIENIQREDLNIIEQAKGIAQLVSAFDLTHQKAAEMLGMSRATISNILRLLRLVPLVQDMLSEGQIEMGHARALLALEPKKQESLAKRVINLNLTVRATEAWVKRLLNKENSTDKPDIASPVASKLAEMLKLKVQVKPQAKGAHRITIHCKNVTELQALVDKLEHL